MLLSRWSLTRVRIASAALDSSNEVDVVGRRFLELLPGLFLI